MTFDDAFEKLMKHEGGYVNHPNDPGGETMWGVTKMVARANGYDGDMRSFPREKAKEIAYKDYWVPCGADRYDAVIGYQVFDAAYNHGIKNAIRFLQRAIDVTDDGIVGPITIAAVNSMPVEKVLLRFNASRLDFYTRLNNWSSFGKGWARRIVGNLDYAAEGL